MIEYLIDGANRRIGKKVNGTLVKGWLWSGLSIVAELNGSGQMLSRFVPGGMVKNGTLYKIIRDHLGSPRVVVNASTGQVVQRMDYDEWGNVTLDTAPGFQPQGFAGGLWDPDTALVRFGARDYDPWIGRWTIKDPIGFSGGQANLYGYVNNDPVNLRDPSGLADPDVLNAIPAPGGPRNTFLQEPFTEDLAGWNNMTATLSFPFRTVLGPILGLWRLYDNRDKLDHDQGYDVFYHCVSQCEARQDGIIASWVAEIIGELRELWTGDSKWSDYYRDTYANSEGVKRGCENPFADCDELCSSFRKPGWNPYDNGRPIPQPLPR